MKLRIAMAAAVGLASVGLVATPASAAETTTCEQLYNHGIYVADGCFVSQGDWIQVTDLYGDGLRAVVEWQTDYGRAGECHDANGAGPSPVNCNYDMAEQGYVRFRVALRNGANGANQAQSNWTVWLGIDGS